MVWQFFLSVRSVGLTQWATWWTELFRPRWIVLGTLLLSLYLLWRSAGWQAPAALYPAGAVTAAVSLTHLLKPVIDRPRPPEGLRLVVETSGAMPSGHATAVVALATVITVAWTARRWLILLAWLNALVVMTTRLYLGVHWLSDVLAGAVLGVVVPLLLTGLLRFACSRRGQPAGGVVILAAPAGHR